VGARHLPTACLNAADRDLLEGEVVRQGAAISEDEPHWLVTLYDDLRGLERDVS
jgi:hypothetical protein